MGRIVILLYNTPINFPPVMAPAGSGEALSAARARFAGPSGIKGIVASGKTTGIAFFASLGGFVYGYNQGMFAQVLTMHSFDVAVSFY
jgi:hypothetical protein